MEANNSRIQLIFPIQILYATRKSTGQKELTNTGKYAAIFYFYVKLLSLALKCYHSLLLKFNHEALSTTTHIWISADGDNSNYEYESLWYGTDRNKPISVFTVPTVQYRTGTVTNYLMRLSKVGTGTFKFLRHKNILYSRAGRIPLSNRSIALKRNLISGAKEQYKKICEEQRAICQIRILSGLIPRAISKIKP